jgi:hypothetical protein
VLSHTLFSLFANPIRYVWGLGAAAMMLAVIFLIWSFLRLLADQVSVFTFIISLTLAVIALMLFSFGVIAQQGYMIQKEIWTLKQSMMQLNQEFKAEREIESNE